MRASGVECTAIPRSSARGFTQMRSSANTGQREGKVGGEGVCSKCLCIQRSGRPHRNHSLMSPMRIGRQRPVAFERAQEPLYLLAPLVGPQAEVRREHAHRRAAAIELDVERAARLAALDAQIETLYRQHAKAREQPVAVIGAVAQQRRARDRFETGLAFEIGEHVETGRARLDFLQRDHVGVDFLQHVRDALRHEVAVAPDAAVRVVGRDRDAVARHASLAPA